MAKKLFKKSVKKKREEVSVKKEKESTKITKIRVIGIGGGAGNIVSEIASRIKPACRQAGKISFVAANTDYQALRVIPKNVLSFRFGESFTHGLGTGMNPELAKEAALEENERIEKLFQGFDFCILVSSLGGGVGSGAIPIFAKAAKKTAAITLGIFTLPFKFEGEKKQQIAEEALQELRPYFNAVAVLPNDKIFQTIEKNAPLKEALSAINKNLSESLQGLIETIYLPGLINIDFADLKTVLEGQGKIAYLNTVEARSDNPVIDSIKKVLNCPFYPYTIQGAKQILFNIGGDKALAIADISQISKMIFELANPEAKIIFGISQNKIYQDKIKIMLLATGCQAKIFLDKEKSQSFLRGDRPKKKLSLKKEKKVSKTVSSFSKKKIRQKKVSFPSVNYQKKSEKPLITDIEKQKVEKDKRSKPKKKKVEIQVKTKKEVMPIKGSQKEKISPPQEKKDEFSSRLNETKNKFSPPSEMKNKSSSLPDSSFRNEMKTWMKNENLSVSKKIEAKIRKNGLQIKKEVEESEKEFLEKEKMWETPAFLRGKKS